MKEIIVLLKLIVGNLVQMKIYFKQADNESVIMLEKEIHQKVTSLNQRLDILPPNVRLDILANLFHLLELLDRLKNTSGLKKTLSDVDVSIKELDSLIDQMEEYSKAQLP